MSSERTPRPLADWHEELGPVLWWKFPLEEPPYVGTPLDLGIATRVQIDTLIGSHLDTEITVGGWPGYHTHWTPLPTPETPLGRQSLGGAPDEQ